MATFDKRISVRTNKISWRARIRRKGLPDLIKTFPRKTDAKLWAEEKETAIHSGLYTPSLEAKRHCVNDVLDIYEPEILQSLKDPYSRLKHLSTWRQEIGDIKLDELTKKHIKNFRKKLRNKVSDATANRYVASISAALSYAVEEPEWLIKNPALGIKKLPEPDGRKRFLNDEERDNLVAASASFPNYPEMHAIILIAITAGMRRGEILNLKWSDCDFGLRRLLIEDSKNEESRSVPLVGPALTSLIRWSKVRPLDSDVLVFPSHTKGAKNRPLDIDHAWRLVREAAGLTNFRFHDLRHTAASYLAMSGAGLRDIGDILGHKSLSMTLRYSHLTDDHKRKTVSRMVDTYFGAQI